MAKSQNAAPVAAKQETPEQATETAPEQATAQPQTSEKLTALEASKLEQMKLMAEKMASNDVVGANEAMFEAFKLDNQINAEKQAIKNAIAAAKIAEAKQAKIGLLQKVVDLAKTAPDSDEFKAAFDVVANELTNKFVAPKTASSTAGGESNAARNGNTDAILNKHIANVAAGLDDAASRKALEADGYARSTVWHTVNNYNKSKLPA